MCLIKYKKAPESVDLIQAVVFIQTQHDVLDHVQTFLLLPGKTFTLAAVTAAWSVSSSFSLFFIILVIIFTSRKRQTVNDRE